MALLPSPKGNLFWLDAETDGFDPVGGLLLEVACVVTTPNLEVLDSICVQIKFPEGAELNWNSWCLNTHTNNGLIADCKKQGVEKKAAEAQLCLFVKKWVEKHEYSEQEDPKRKYQPPLCGSGVGFDRKWLEVHMPDLIRMFSYRNIDVSVFYELAARSKKDFSEVENNLPDYPHRALDDIKRSIELLRRYKKALRFDGDVEEEDEFVVERQTDPVLREQERELMAHRYLYYVLATPVIPDYEYDRREHLLRQRLGEDSKSPMMLIGSSLSSTYTQDEIDLAKSMVG